MTLPAYDRTVERIVVAIDGSPAAWDALAWAAVEAATLRCPLVVAHGTRDHEGRPHDGDPARCCGYGRELLADAVSRLSESHPALEVHTFLHGGAPAAMLVELSHGSRLIVIGRPRKPELVELVVGSTEHSVLAHAHCPVVVVRRPPHKEQADTIVVGVSLGASGIAALDFACDEASRRHADVLGLRSLIDYGWVLGEAGRRDAGLRGAQLEQETLDRWLDLAARRHPGVFVRGELTHAALLEALRERARPAALLVVGTPSDPDARHPQLFGIAEWESHHADCAVAVVHRWPALQPVSEAVEGSAAQPVTQPAARPATQPATQPAMASEPAAQEVRPHGETSALTAP